MENSFQENSLAPSQEIHYGGFWIRFVAFALDSLILIIPSLVLTHLIPIVGGLIVGVMYKPFFESSALQATPGKALMGLRVTTLDDRRISFKQAFIRFLSTFLSSALLLIGYIMIAFTEKKQALHDLIADTLVIYHRPPDINYFTAWLDEVQGVFGFGESVVSHPERESSENIAAKLEELHALYNKGVLTEEEYKNKKDELLKRI